MLVPLVMVSVILFVAYAYVFLGLRAPLDDGSPWRIVALAAVALGPVLHLSSFAMQFSGRSGALHDRLSMVSFVLMGFFAYLFMLSIARDVVFLLAGFIAPERLTPSPHQVANAGIVGLSLFLTVTGFFSARKTPRLAHVDVPIAGLPRALDGFTIAQLTDVHVGPTIKRTFIERVVERTNGATPDAIVITGDLIDGRVAALEHDVAPLAELRARHGVFYVTGNHEYYSGAPEWVRHVEKLGMTTLLNRHLSLVHDGETLVMAGVADETAGMFIPDHACSPARALEGAPDAPTVLLAHQPRSVKRIVDERVDVMLSGHTHGGQFWPWTLLVPLQQPYVAGLVKHRSTWVYTSRGTGYWGPPLRFLAPSEIALVRLVAA